MADTLYNKYRPKTLSEVVGQPEAVQVLKKYLDNGGPPNALLLHGPPGTGKTTVANALARHLKATSTLNFTEVNCAVMDPMETVKSISEACNFHPAAGKHRVWVLEEAQSMSRAGFAQQGLLKALESAPKHNYFFLTATDPKKISAAVRSRCTEIRMKPLQAGVLVNLVQDVARKEGRPVSPGLAGKVADMAGGSARNALVLLERVLGFDGEKEQAAALDRADPEKVAFDLVKALMPFKGTPDWREAARVLEAVKDESPERIRQLVLSAARTTLLKGGPGAGRAAAVIETLRDPFFGETIADHALLAALCYSLCQGR